MLNLTFKIIMLNLNQAMTETSPINLKLWFHSSRINLIKCLFDLCLVFVQLHNNVGRYQTMDMPCQKSALCSVFLEINGFFSCVTENQIFVYIFSCY